MKEAKVGFVLDQVELPRSATQCAVDTLRHAIISGKLKAGTQLVQNKIAESLNVSRMPIREALRILEAEGWVEFSPRRGSVVTSFSPTDVAQVFEIRFALEALALQKSIPFLDDNEFETASFILKKMDTEKNVDLWVDLHTQFHLTLYSYSGKRVLDLIKSHFKIVDRYLKLELLKFRNEQESQDEHRQILLACRNRDVTEAVQILRLHILEAGWDLSSSLRSQGA